MQQLELASTTQRWVLSRESKVLNTKFLQKFQRRVGEIDAVLFYIPRGFEVFLWGGGGRSQHPPLALPAQSAPRIDTPPGSC